MKNEKLDSVLELPLSCKSVQERMMAEIMKEDLEEEREKEKAAKDTFHVAQLNDSCKEKIKEFEQELNKQGCWNISLVAYQKD